MLVTWPIGTESLKINQKCLINGDNQYLIYIILWFVVSELGLCILHCCYVKGRSKFIMPKTRTNRLKSFLSCSVRILNSVKCDRAL